MTKIPLTQNKFTIIDDIDAHFAGLRWHASYQKQRGIYYAIRSVKKPNGKRSSVMLHHCILGRPTSREMVIDHINGDGLDNRRENLRFVLAAENIGNSRRRREGRTVSKYVGVFPSRGHGKRWVAMIGKNRKRWYIGTYDTQEEARDAYLGVLKNIWPGAYPTLKRVLKPDEIALPF